MLDDLLAGVERAEDFLADGLLGDALDERVDDVEVDVGFEQGLADLAQAFADVGLGEPAAAAQLLERVAEALLNAFEHAGVACETGADPTIGRESVRLS